MRAFGRKAATMSPTAPVPAPMSAITSPGSPAAAAARRTASLPARWPPAGWTSCTRPASSVSRVVSFMPQLGLQPRLADQPPRLVGIVLWHEHAPRKCPDHSLKRAHLAVSHEDRDLGVLQKGL